MSNASKNESVPTHAENIKTDNNVLILFDQNPSEQKSKECREIESKLETQNLEKILNRLETISNQVYDLFNKIKDIDNRLIDIENMIYNKKLLNNQIIEPPSKSPTTAPTINSFKKTVSNRIEKEITKPNKVTLLVPKTQIHITKSSPSPTTASSTKLASSTIKPEVKKSTSPIKTPTTAKSLVTKTTTSTKSVSPTTKTTYKTVPSPKVAAFSATKLAQGPTVKKSSTSMKSQVPASKSQVTKTTSLKKTAASPNKFTSSSKSPKLTLIKEQSRELKILVDLLN